MIHISFMASVMKWCLIDGEQEEEEERLCGRFTAAALLAGLPENYISQHLAVGELEGEAEEGGVKASEP